MSEFRRQIALGAVVAVLLAAGLGFGAGYYFPPQTAQSTASSSAGTASSTVSSATTAVTSSATAAQTTTLVTLTQTTTSGPVPTTTTLSSITSSSVSSETTVTYTTTSGVTTCASCSGLQIVSANITISATSQSFLSISVRNGGSDNASNLTITLGSTRIVVIPELDAGQQTWVSVQLPNQAGVQSGVSYRVTVNAQFGFSVIETSTSVTATRG